MTYQLDMFVPAAVRDLRIGNGYWYLGSPYSRHPGGLEDAFAEICQIAAKLIGYGVPVFSPIAHSHSIAKLGDIDPLDHGIWLPADRPLVDAAHGLIVAKMESWKSSYGLAVEIDAFASAGKPIIYLDPSDL